MEELGLLEIPVFCHPDDWPKLLEVIREMNKDRISGYEPWLVECEPNAAREVRLCSEARRA